MKKKYKFNKLQLKWLKALESGEYAQSQGALCDGKGFCCLGVACDVSGVQFKQFKSGEYAFGRAKQAAFLPREVVSELKTHDKYGTLSGPHRIGKETVTTLYDANDNGVRFSSIARFIRQHPEAVFTDAK